MEYINSRKRLIIDRHILGNRWLLQYRVKTKWFGYNWITVALCPVYFDMTVNEAIEHLQSVRDHSRIYTRHNNGTGFIDLFELV